MEFIRHMVKGEGYDNDEIKVVQHMHTTSLDRCLLYVNILHDGTLRFVECVVEGLDRFTFIISGVRKYSAYAI
jgi:hypothetical protein